MQHQHHHHKHSKVLFILKLRQDYTSEYGANHLATGMYNSAKFVSDMLDKSGINSEVVIVVDNNAIDREVARFKPTHVFIEGIWVVPEKFAVLKRLHPKVKWIIRCHSEIPFLAQEGNAINWIFEYMKHGVYVSGNSPRVNQTLQSVVGGSLQLEPEDLAEQMPLLPNYYPTKYNSHQGHTKFTCREEPQTFRIGCFGAIRPLKNQLMQAVAAVEFAKSRGTGLEFHLNSGRVEQKGENQLKNIRSLFKQLSESYGEGPTGFKLVEHPWMDHKTFKKLLITMDLCMQVSMSETFNIVTADAISVGTPTVVSDEVIWGSSKTWAKTTDINNIVDTLDYVWEHRRTVAHESFECLQFYSAESKRQWVEYLTK